MMDDTGPPAARPSQSAAFLLAKLGFAAAARFGERMAALGLTPRQAGLLRAIAADEGASQSELAGRLGMPTSRMVAEIDELEADDLVERRPNPADRRAHALHLTRPGRRVLDRVARAAAAHDRELTAPLDAGQRAELVELLRSLAGALDVPLDVHPGLATGPPF